LKGWQWGAFDSVQAWGTNVVTGTLNFPPFGDLMYFDFDRNGLFDEGALSNGDSGGGVFINSGGTWKLAGINFSADGRWRTSPERPPFDASIFDAGGLYLDDNPPFYIADNTFDVPGASYSTLVSSRLSWIRGITGTVPGPSNAPEPAAVATLAVGTGATLLRRRRG
jgi:hypothetical protein